MATDVGPIISLGGADRGPETASTGKTGGFAVLLVLIVKSALGYVKRETLAKRTVVAIVVCTGSGTLIWNIWRTSRSTMLPATLADASSGNIAYWTAVGCIERATLEHDAPEQRAAV